MKRTNSKKGFTLMEVLIAIGVIAILCAIAIPAIVKSKNSLSNKQSNDYAKSIYLAAQDNIASMRIAATPEFLEGSISFRTIYDQNNNILSEIKELLSEDLQNELLTIDENREYNYITSDDEGFDKILPPESIDPSIRNMKITIIFNPWTGDVLYVRYGDNGEYSGSVVNRPAETINKDGNEITPIVSLTNGQECLVSITVPVPEEYLARKQAFFDAITFNITVSDSADKTKNFSYSFSGAKDDFKINTTTNVVTWVLDSLRSGHTFADKSSGKIASGNNVNVSVTYSFDAAKAGGNDVVFVDTSSVAQGNPLFASFKNNIISVNNGRNLQNLNNIDSAIASALASSGAEVTLGSNIAWGKTVEYYQSYIKDFRSFTPLAAEKLFAKDSKVIFNGNGKSIVNLFEKNIADAGLFTLLYGTVKDLTFKDPMISGGANCGALAAVADGATIDNCSVVISSKSENITDAVASGQESANASAIIFGCVSSDKDSSVGLLCGNITNEAKMTNCVVNMKADTKDVAPFFSIPASAKNFGLLVGTSYYSDISNCTVEGDIVGGQATDIGLLAGEISGSASDCLISGTIANIGNASSKVGGVAGYVYSGNYSNVNVSGFIGLNDSLFKGGIIGGAFGQVESGNFNNISSNVKLNIKNAFAISEKVGDFVPALFGDNGEYACPSGLGYAGKFVGYVESGSFSNCSATGAASDKYSGMQFVGVVKPKQYDPSGDFYESTVKLSKTVEADQAADGSNKYFQKDGSAVFVPATKYWKYEGITLKNCLYTAADKKTYNQEILPDRNYYTLSNRQQGTQYQFKEIEGEYDYNDPTPFIVLDDTRQFAFILNSERPEATLYTVNGITDFYPNSAYTRVKDSTTPVYFFNPTNTKKTYTPSVMTDENGNTVYGLAYKDKNWPTKTRIRKTDFNVIDTYFVMNDTAVYTSKYDHVVYDVGNDYNDNYATGFEFNVTNGYYNSRNVTNGSYRNPGYGTDRNIIVSPALVYTDTLRFRLSTMPISGFSGASSNEVVIRENDYYNSIKNAFWQNVSLKDAGFNSAERSGTTGKVLLRNMAYPNLTRTLAGETKSQDIFLTIADDLRDWTSDTTYQGRGALMTPSISYAHTDVPYDWRIDGWNVRSLTIENQLDSNGDNYTTIARETVSGRDPFYLGMLQETLYTKHTKDINDPSFSHLHLYALISDENGDSYSYASFSPANSPAQIISSTKVS